MSLLYERGFTSDQIRCAVHRGTLVRPRRGWVAVPECDKVKLGAAAAGVVLTCITQAKRLGLWVLNHKTPHYASRKPSSRVAAGNGVLHRAEPPVPRPPGVVEDPLENVLWIVASCQPFESALAIWDSALNRGLTSYEQLDQLPLRARARRVLEATSPYADSGLETFVRSRLRWLKVPIWPQTVLLGRRVDFLIGDRLVLQIDGGHHVGAQRRDDIEHDARLLKHGYRVIRVGYSQVVHEWPSTQSTILHAIARGFHRS